MTFPYMYDNPRVILYRFSPKKSRLPRLRQAYGLHSKALNWIQILGASLTVLGGILYGKARQCIEREAQERQALLPGAGKALGK